MPISGLNGFSLFQVGRPRVLRLFYGYFLPMQQKKWPYRRRSGLSIKSNARVTAFIFNA
jgi:hypothetical protein